MKANPLLSRFDLIADAPGNIQRLRELVVHLAVSGRLADDLNDRISIREILSDIATKKQALIKTGKAKKQRALPPIDETELPEDVWTAIDSNVWKILRYSKRV